jgi:hypothetical protein
MRRQQVPQVLKIIVTEEDAILVFGPLDDKRLNEQHTWNLERFKPLKIVLAYTTPSQKEIEEISSLRFFQNRLS